MPTINASATLKSDISFTLVQLGSNAQSEAGATNYTAALTTPTGVPTGLEINYGVQTSGSLSAGSKAYFDLQSFTKDSFGGTQTVSFTKVKGIVIENQETEYLYELRVAATGGNAWTDPWNGGSGNVIAKPYATWQYLDPISGSLIDGTNKDFFIEDVLGSGVRYSMVVVGVTG